MTNSTTLTPDSQAFPTTLEIVCPPWCASDPQEHTDHLWDCGGQCYHRPAEVVVTDPSDGPDRGMGDDPLPGGPVSVSFAMVTSPEGREVSSPTFHIDDRDYSLEQVSALVEALNHALETYSATTTRN